ncbi:HEAT repeat domain-containing protein [Pantanalinema rosaneae CENA516]|uniref:HEAT repeat domain-containing protein n=1 Tax=Pantanalinema rosaneae TaxID=1620701 RepID=UPI003D6E826C
MSHTELSSSGAKLHPLKTQTITLGLSLLLLVTTGCGGRDSRIVELETQKNVTELINLLKQQEPLSAQAAEALGNIGDKQAVDALIQSVSVEADVSIRKQAVTALGKLQDSRAAKPLITALQDPNPQVREATKTALKDLAAKDPKVIKLLMPGLTSENRKVLDETRSALAAIGTPAVDPMIKALKDDNAMIRLGAAIVLGDIGDQKAIKPLAANLTDWYSNLFAARALAKLDWEPQTDTDKIRFLVAQQKGGELRQNWATAKTVLLKDVESNDYRAIQTALYAFISIGDRDIVNTLIKSLETKGNKTMALAYLNSGESQLSQAAKNWAESRGYEVVKTMKNQGVQPVTWGGW